MTFFFLILKFGKTGNDFETIDPRTGGVIARIAEGRKEDIDVAVKAARVAFDSGPWPRMPGAVRYHFSFSFSDYYFSSCYSCLLSILRGGMFYWVFFY